MDYHLIGICGTAMASLAGMLQARGHHVTGSDLNVYPPMSTMLEQLGINVSQGFKREHLTPAPDCVIVGNAIPRGNLEVEETLGYAVRQGTALGIPTPTMDTCYKLIAGINHYLQ